MGGPGVEVDDGRRPIIGESMARSLTACNWLGKA